MKSISEQHIQAVRRFNRFYTQQLGVLQEGLLHSPFSLTEVRVLYELAHRKNATATEILQQLGLDRGYLSRILERFARNGLIARRRVKSDKRRSLLSLTPKGRRVFAPLNRRSSEQVASWLVRLPMTEQDRLIHATGTVQSLLAADGQPQNQLVLRPHRPGDIGWVIHRHGVLYSQEYSWDERFEALVAEIAAKFIQNLDAQRERCWIAELDGAIAGCVFLVKESNRVAKLRLLLVEPWARGHGLGKRLVEECIGFSREAGYKKITLWTNSALHAARHIYDKTGFRLIHKEAHQSFGHNLVAETWELKL